MKHHIRFYFLLLWACIAVGCGAIRGDRYQDVAPVIDLRAFFQGDVEGWGIVQNRSGNIVQRFHVTIQGHVRDDQLILDEQFEYDIGDGPATRQWVIAGFEDNALTGTAGDISGEAQGKVYGNALSWYYEMDVPLGKRKIRVKLEDWMWAFDERHIMNRSYIKKFGIVVAEVTLFLKSKKEK